MLQGLEQLALQELARALRVIESGEELFSAAQIYLKSNQKSRAASLAAIFKKSFLKWINLRNMNLKLWQK
jgi:hypothetical protein